MNTFLTFTTTLLMSAALASAHGVQTQITYDATNNKIDTRSLIYTSNPTATGQAVPVKTVTAERRAYIVPLLYAPIGAGSGWYARFDPQVDPNTGAPYHPSGAGPAWQYESVGTTSVAGTGWSYSGSSTLPNLQGTAFRYKLLDGLKVWNGTGFVDPGDEQAQLISGDGTASFTPTATNNLTTGDAGPAGSLVLSTITSLSSTNNAHAAISVRLLGDGSTLAAGDDGIYLLKLALATNATVGSTNTHVGDSDPFYFVLTKNAAYEDALAATQSLGIDPSLVQGQVPEPGTLSLVACAFAAITRRRQRVVAATTAALATTASIASAHEGPRVWVAQRDGKLVTQTSDDDYDPSAYSDARVFAGELSPYFGTYTTQFPGFEAPRDGSGNLGNGPSIGFKIAGPLLTLDSAGTALLPTSERFAGSPAPQLGITFPDIPGPAYTRYTAGGVVNGFTFTSEIEEHSHLAYTFLGDGTSATASGPDGVYVLPLVLTGSGLAQSDWFFLVLNRAGSADAVTAASIAAQRMAAATSGDADFRNGVGFADLLTLAKHYNQQSGNWWATGDFDADGDVDFADLLTLAKHYNAPTTASYTASLTAAFAADWSLARSLVPEPTALAALGLLACVGRRRSACDR